MKKMLFMLSAALMLTILAVGVTFTASAETSCDHAWDGGAITKKPTHTETGEKTFTCTECGLTKTEVVDKTTAHNFGACVMCDENQHQRTCECGKTIVSSHTWNLGVITTQPTHRDTGVMTYSCTAGCGAEKTETLGTVDYHVYIDKYTSIDFNKHTAFCVCGDSIEEVHDYEILEENLLYRCTQCGYMPPIIDGVPRDPSDSADNNTGVMPKAIGKIKDLLGCQSIVSIGTGLSLILTVSAAGVLFRKKKED